MINNVVEDTTKTNHTLSDRDNKMLSLISEELELIIKETNVVNDCGPDETEN